MHAHEIGLAKKTSCIGISPSWNGGKYNGGESKVLTEIYWRLVVRGSLILFKGVRMVSADVQRFFVNMMLVPTDTDGCPY